MKDLGKWIRVRRWAGGFYFACILLNLLILVYCTRIWYGYGKGAFYGIQLGYYFRLVLADISCSKANATHATWIPYPDDKRWMRRRERTHSDVTKKSVSYLRLERLIIKICTSGAYPYAIRGAYLYAIRGASRYVIRLHIDILRTCK